MPETLTIDAIQQWLNRFASEITTQADWLTELDSAIGDADHGTNMVRGTAAVVAKLDDRSTKTVQELLKAVGMTLVSTVGGASGSLYGTFFLEMGRNSPSSAQLDASELENALRAGVNGVIARGHAAVGDKTMIDALEPAVTVLSQSWLTAGNCMAPLRPPPLRRRPAGTRPNRSSHAKAGRPISVTAAPGTSTQEPRQRPSWLLRWPQASVKERHDDRHRTRLT